MQMLSVKLVLLLALFIALNVDYAIVYANVNHQHYRTIESYMDVDVNPCIDFYDYACYNWAQRHVLDAYKDTIGLVDYEANREYERIFKKYKHRKGDVERPSFIQNILNYHQSCVRMENFDPRQYLYIVQKRENISWPSAVPRRRSAQKSRLTFDWVEFLAVLRKYAFNSILLEQIVMQQRENSRLSAVDIDKPVMNGGFKRLDNWELVLVLEYLNVTDKRKVEQLWDEVKLFETMLLSLNDIDEEDDSEYQFLTLAQLNMTWLDRYLSIVLNKTVAGDMKISVQNLPYLRALHQLLDNYEPEFICRYLMFRFIFYLHNQGPTNFYPNDCTTHTRSMLSTAMYWLYERHNPQIQKDVPHIEALFQNLLRKFNDTLNRNLNYFGDDVMQFLHAKVAGMRIKIGNLPRASTIETLVHFYTGLNLSANDFYENHLQLLFFYTKSQQRELQEPKHDDDSFFYNEDDETGMSSSPYYLIRYNMVIVPPTLLRPPIYHQNFHPVLKYSILGFLLAHEITHAFDESAMDFDQDGNMRGPSDHIKENDIYSSHMLCVRNMHPQNLDEKIADVSGLRLAYETYFNNASTTRADRPLHWAPYTEEGLFFLNFAQFFCGAESDLVAPQHGADRQRVKDTLANFAEFGVAYKCPKGSKMNPRSKCQVWR